jgi:OOP family OmpA-OmpF porin
MRAVIVSLLLVALTLAWGLGAAVTAHAEGVDPPAHSAPPAVVVACDEVVLSEPLTFDTGAVTLTDASRGLLGQVAAAVLAEPWIHQITVEVHTDSTGSSAYNARMSQERANAVVEALVVAGLPPSAVLGHGRGEDHPIAPNTTAEGREANRRVEIRITERDDCPADE